LNYIAVLIGGFLGALARGWLNSLAFSKGWIIPIHTLLINLTGSFIIVFILTITSGVLLISPRVTLGLTTGFLGAFTTFSTFTVEVINLGENGHYLRALTYIVISNLGGLFLGWLGLKLALHLKGKSYNQEILAGEKE
jgi:fluoride exporter